MTGTCCSKSDSDLGIGKSPIDLRVEPLMSSTGVFYFVSMEEWSIELGRFPRAQAYCLTLPSFTPRLRCFFAIKALTALSSVLPGSREL